MTTKPDFICHVDYSPKSDRFDLTERIKYGVNEVLNKGIDNVFIIEEDDYYEPDYFETMRLGTNDFVGCNQTTYYNIQNKTWQTMEHRGRASLFHTGFKISALNGFRWPSDDHVFLDIVLWQHAKNAKFVEQKAIGIKHGIGLCGGRGHKMTMKNSDPDFNWLSQHVEKEALEFYKSLV